MDPITGATVAKGLGTVIGAGANYFANRSNARAARKAQEDANRILQEGIDFQKGVYTDAQGNVQPMIETGKRATSEWEKAQQDFVQPTLNYQQKDFGLDNWKDPGYQFRLDEANKSINAKMAAAGMNTGSGALKALQTRGQDMASQEYANSYDRFLKDSAMRYGQAADQYGRDYQYGTGNIDRWGDIAKTGTSTALGLQAGGNAGAANMMKQQQEQASNAGNAAIAQGYNSAAGWNMLGDLGAQGAETGYYALDEYVKKAKKNPANVMKNSVIGQANKQGSLL